MTETVNSTVAVNNRKVAIIGCGFVGSSTAFALMQNQENELCERN